MYARLNLTYSASKCGNNALQKNGIGPLNAFLDNMVSIAVLHTVNNMALQLTDELSLFDTTIVHNN